MVPLVYHVVLFFSRRVGISTNGPSDIASKEGVKTEGLHINGPTVGKKMTLGDFDTNGYEAEHLSNHSKFPPSNARSENDFEEKNERAAKGGRSVNSDGKESPGSETSQAAAAPRKWEEHEAIDD